MSKRIVQIHSSSISLDQILCGVESQKLISLRSKRKVFFVSRKSYPGPSLIQFRLKGNNKSKSVSKRVAQCHSLPFIPRNTWILLVKILSPRIYLFSKMAVKWSNLTWPSKSPKFNLHHLRKLSAGFKMAVLTPKLGTCWYYIMLVC